MKQRTAFLTTIVALVFHAQLIHAAPIQWTIASGGNGNYYDSVTGTLNWPQARTAAESMTYLGIPGHLATITSQAELDFIGANLPGGSHWLGGYQDTNAPDYAEPAGGWRWVTGEPWLFTKWHTGEPNNQSGDENILEWHSDGLGWNDLDVRDLRPAYYVEFSIPEPTAYVLSWAACSLAILGWRKW